MEVHRVEKSNEGEMSRWSASLFEMVNIFIMVGVKVTHDNDMESIFDSGFDVFNNELAKNYAFCSVVMFLKAIIVNDFKFSIGKKKVDGDKSTAVSVDFLDILRNEVSKN